MKQVLKGLNRSEFSNIQVDDEQAFRYLKECEKKMHMNPWDGEVCDQERNDVKDYNKIHDMYISFLQQMAKISWNIGGDENS